MSGGGEASLPPQAATNALAASESAVRVYVAVRFVGWFMASCPDR
jgi:hypothetical protein